MHSCSSSAWCFRTVCVLRTPSLDLPHFLVRPELALVDALGKVLGGQDINFDQDPDFSKAFVLQGQDPEATRELFDQRVRLHFLRYRNRRLRVEGCDRHLLLHDNKRRKPGETKDLEDLTLSLFNLFRAADDDQAPSAAS